MDRRDRDRYDRNDYGHEYGRYDDYERNDNHYHSARNLTDEFERDYQRERGGYRDDDRDRNRMRHSYHEGDMGDTYERLSRQRGDNNNYSSDRRNDRAPDMDYSRAIRNNRDVSRDYQGYFTGEKHTYRRDRDDNRWSAGQGYYSGAGDDYGSARSGDDMSNRNRGQFRNSGRDRDGYSNYYNEITGGEDMRRESRGDDRRDRDYTSGSRSGWAGTSDSPRNFEDNYGSGMDSSSGDRRYGRRIGYRSGNGDMDEGRYNRDRSSGEGWFGSERNRYY